MVVVSTSDELPARKVLATNTAQSIAEKYRRQGKNVLLMVDSLTRYARAVRDLSLSVGELPVRQGYPAQVYQKLPQLIERAGNDSHGTITAIYTVLTNPDGSEDPLADEIKSLLDGHLYLDANLANLSIRPAINIEKSISRLNYKLLTSEQIQLQNLYRKYFVRWLNEKDMAMFSNNLDEELKSILNHENQILNFIKQDKEEKSPLPTTWQELNVLLASITN